MAATVESVAISAIHHLGLTVRAVHSSAVWYESVLGFEPAGSYGSPGGERQKVFLRHHRLDVRLGLTQHGSGSRDDFDETRVGLDHLAFRVNSEAELFDWQDRLASLGVQHSPISPANSIPGAAVLVFRDPDNIQLELIFDPTTS